MDELIAGHFHTCVGKNMPTTHVYKKINSEVISTESNVFCGTKTNVALRPVENFSCKSHISQNTKLFARETSEAKQFSRLNKTFWEKSS